MKDFITTALDIYYESKRKIWPVNVMRASEIGHPCERYLYLQLTQWQDKSLPDRGLVRIFEFGNGIERYVNYLFQNANIPIIEAQRPYCYPDPKITGHIDGKILINDKVYPIEIKGFSQGNWPAINSIDDMLNSKQYYMQKYPYQLNLYMLMGGEELGYFVLFNKQNADIKVIPMKLDYDLGEQTLQKAQRIYTAVKEKIEPPASSDVSICASCSFSHICLPMMTKTAELDLMTDPELESQLIQLEDLKRYKSQYERLDKELTARLKLVFDSGHTKLAIGTDWIIQGKKIQKKTYNIPDDIKVQYEESMEYWRKSIKHIPNKIEEESNV